VLGKLKRVTVHDTLIVCNDTPNLTTGADCQCRPLPRPPMCAPAFLRNQLAELGSSLNPTPGNRLDYSTKPHYASWNSAGQTISRRSKCLMQSRRI